MKNLALIALLTAAACGTDQPFDDRVDDHRNRIKSGLPSTSDLTDCGAITFDNSPAPSCEPIVAAQTCLLNSANDCAPAELRVTYYTVEGQPIREFWFVGSSCELTRFSDHSADSWRGDYGPHMQEDCENPRLLETSGCGLLAADCTTTAEW